QPGAANSQKKGVGLETKKSHAYLDTSIVAISQLKLSGAIAYLLYDSCMTALEDLSWLRAFVQVAESGSISAASRVLGLSQPTLSRRLQSLERSLNTPLIRRDTHSMSLTEAGRVLLPEARNLLALADRASQKLLAERQSLHGHLRIVSVVDVGQWVVAQALAQFQSLHPLATAELHLINRP